MEQHTCVCVRCVVYGLWISMSHNARNIIFGVVSCMKLCPFCHRKRQLLWICLCCKFSKTRNGNLLFFREQQQPSTRKNVFSPLLRIFSRTATAIHSKKTFLALAANPLRAATAIRQKILFIFFAVNFPLSKPATGIHSKTNFLCSENPSKPCKNPFFRFFFSSYGLFAADIGMVISLLN